MRTKLENTEEFAVLEKVIKRYKFNLVDDENVEDLDALPSPPHQQSQKRYLEGPSWHDDDDDNDADNDANLDNAAVDDIPGTSSKRLKSDVKDYETIRV